MTTIAELRPDADVELTVVSNAAGRMRVHVGGSGFDEIRAVATEETVGSARDQRERCDCRAEESAERGDEIGTVPRRRSARSWDTPPDQNAAACSMMLTITRNPMARARSSRSNVG